MLNQLATKNQKDIQIEMNNFFEKGNILAEEKGKKEIDIELENLEKFTKLAKRLKLEGLQKRRSENSINKIKEKLSCANRDADPNKITFHDSDSAKEFSYDIQKSVTNIFDDLSKEFNSQSSFIVTEMTNEISKTINDISAQSLKKASNELKDSGFDLKLSAPKLNLEISSFNATDLLSSGMQSKTESVTKWRRSEGVWGTMCSWVGTSDWGWEEYQSKQTSYQIDLNEIHKSILKQLDNYNENHTKQFNDYLIKEFQPKIETHINSLIDYLARYRELLMQGIETNQQSQEDKKKLSDQLSLLMNKNKLQQSDIDAVKRGLG